ncbi:MAG: histidine--tRNA ligase [Armatimonadetes bacterium]|nr:histidine--tRNA ligase [Candidatus Hippobium faecium]
MNYKAPRGTMDLLPGDSPKWQYVEQCFRNICKNYGFSEIRTPTFEHTELFTRNLGESTDVVTKEMYTFNTKGNTSLTLKPEGTAPAMRAYIQNNLANLSSVTKLYYIAKLFRYERPQAGRYREHTQLGIECIGSESPRTDAEIISIAINFIENLGIKEYKLKINSIGCPECRPKFKEALIKYTESHLDELCPTCRNRYSVNPLRMLDCKEEKCREVFKNAPTLIEYLDEDCRTHFEKLKESLETLGIEYTVDNNLVRGFDYYTRTAFEIVSTGLGAQNAICGGGRYDNLIEELGYKSTPSVGFGMGLERLMITLESLGIDIPVNTDPKCYIIASGEQAQIYALKLANTLRKSNIPTEADYSMRSIKAQMKTAGKMNAEYAVIIGDDEIERKEYSVKNMKESIQENVPFDKIEEYLK